MRSRPMPLIAFAVAALAAAPAAAPAWAQADGGAAPAAGVAPPAGFERGSAAHLAALCAATPENPRREAAIGLCYGFMVGVGQFHGALRAARPDLPQLFCLPDPPPTLDTVAKGFVAWSQANAQYGRDRAVDALARYARGAYPCPPTTPGRTR